MILVIKKIPGKPETWKNVIFATYEGKSKVKMGALLLEILGVIHVCFSMDILKISAKGIKKKFEFCNKDN